MSSPSVLLSQAQSYIDSSQLHAEGGRKIRYEYPYYERQFE
ncbi:MAG: hypothetical protein ACP5O0_11505 [Acidimicrobiales bacterium]